MSKAMLLLLICTSVVLGQNGAGVYFNEVRYDDDGSDDSEFIELIGPAGTDLSGMTIVHYNGASSSDGGLIKHTIENFIIPDDGITDRAATPLGFYVLALSDDGMTSLVENWDALTTRNLQGGPDALVLFSAAELIAENVMDAIAWGDMAAADILQDDPGFVSTDVLPSENTFLHVIPENGDSDESIQNSSLVMNNDGSTWHIAAATPGAANPGQESGLVELPVELLNFQARSTAGAILLSWQTESETNNLGFEIYKAEMENGTFEILSSFSLENALKGNGTSSLQHSYSFRDTDVKPGQTCWYKLADVDYNSVRTMHNAIAATMSVEMSAAIPGEFQLHTNYPNPFNPLTRFQLDLPNETSGSLIVYDMLGKRVAILQTGVFTAGQHKFSWDATDNAGTAVGSGIYFITFQSNEFRTAIKAVLAR